MAPFFHCDIVKSAAKKKEKSVVHLHTISATWCPTVATRSPPWWGSYRDQHVIPSCTLFCHTRGPLRPVYFLSGFLFLFIAPPRSCVAHACLSIIDARAICLGFRKLYTGGSNSFLTNGSTQKHLAATRYVVACEVFALIFKKGGKYKNPVPLKDGYHY